MRRVAFVYNPASNSGRSAGPFERLKRQTAGWPETAYRTSRRSGDIRGLAASLAESFDVVAACGGDGTVHEVAGALAGTACALGVVPVGNGNDTAKSLGVPLDVEKSLALLREGRIHSVDLGSCNGRHFINTLGFGFDGEVAGMVREGGGSGRLAYVAAALRTCLMHRRMACGIDGEPVPRALLPLLLPLFIAGRQGWLPVVHSRPVRECRLRFDAPVSAHMDGEAFGEGERDFLVRIHPGGLRAVCGPDAALARSGRERASDL
ncbi:MAG: diacylglycerol kinase family protein [Balneolaceae bacterium]|nr:diacylglycerol kinase family protein [Balneolaceae bacterium]